MIMIINIKPYLAKHQNKSNNSSLVMKKMLLVLKISTKIMTVNKYKSYKPKSIAWNDKAKINGHRFKPKNWVMFKNWINIKMNWLKLQK